MIEILHEPETWVAIAFLIFLGILLRVGVPSLLFKALDDRSARIKSELDEALRLRKEAEQVLKAALDGNPNPVRTHYELGLVYEKEGAPDKALAEFKEGIAKYRQGRG